ncbi:hypothetical protein D3C80_1758880 [compost metagenome]
MLILVIIQNASFTIVSRARNSNSLVYHAGAATASNLAYIFVLKNVVTNLDNPYVIATYVVGSVIGGLAMHWVAMRYFEKKKEAK